MTMLRKLKLSVLHASRAAGLFRLVADSRHRKNQLLILCYHGISIDDEHEWAPGLYMSQDDFARRLEAIRRGRYVVLPLSEAVRRLYEGTLPRRAVAITFDDGNHDFYSRAWPVLDRMGIPATVYLTTYYCENNLPIFPLATSYLMWQRPGMLVDLPVGEGRVLRIDTRSADVRKRSHNALLLHAQNEGMSGLDKDALTARVAELLDADYGRLRQKRMLHIMTPAEARELAAAGVDFELHTHRHRSPLDRLGYVAEITDNRSRVSAYTGANPTHFCYPSGVCMPEFGSWLAAEGVVSGTTCEPGMASRDTDPFQLPRLLDHSEMTGVEFEAWLAGIGAMLPHRPIGFQPVDREGRLIIPDQTPVAAAGPGGPKEPGDAQHVSSMESVS